MPGGSLYPQPLSKPILLDSPANYRISKIIRPSSDTVWFYYNTAGDPDSITFNQNILGSDRIRLLYDTSSRITDIALYSSDSDNFELWHKIYYSNTGKIGTDSVYEFGKYTSSFLPVPQPFRTIHWYRWIWNFEYDGLGRMAKATNKHHTFKSDPYQEFSYDEYKNLEWFNTVYPFSQSPVHYTQYDTAQSIFATHPTWQFLGRDYSKHNRFSASTYNAGNLPTTISLPGSASSEHILWGMLDITGTSQVVYEEY